mgnify:CR=1 FL=1
MKPIEVGVIGLGNFARRQHLPNLSRILEARIRGVCDINPDLTEAIRAKYGAHRGYTDYRKLLEDPLVEAVVVAVRDNLQAEVAAAALRAGKHVYVEKPLGQTPEQFEAVAEAVRESGLRLAVGFNKRFAPIYRRMREIARSDGGPRNMHLRMADDAWRWAVGYPPGFMMKLDVCHFFDLLRWFTGGEIESVYCASSRPDDDAVLVQMSNGTVATILFSGHGTMDMPKERIDIITERGGLSAEDYVELRTFGYTAYDPVYTFPGHSNPDGEFMHRYLMGKLGMPVWSAIRRMTWELRIRTGMDPGTPQAKVREEGGTGAGDLEGTEAPGLSGDPYMEEARRFAVATIPNFMRGQGWMDSLRAFLAGIANNLPTAHAGVEDAEKAALAAAAAEKSRETSEVVRL